MTVTVSQPSTMVEMSQRVRSSTRNAAVAYAALTKYQNGLDSDDLHGSEVIQALHPMG